MTLFIITALFFSCKSGKTVTDGSTNESVSTKTIIKNHYSNELKFRTLSGRIRVEYSDGSAVQSVGVSLRMEKDKAIWLSAPLGIVKAYITPSRVSFYNKLENEYFDGDFSYLSNLLGTDLDFDKVQNLLFGQAVFDLRDEKYVTQIKGDVYELKPKNSNDLFKLLFLIEPENYKIAVQQLSQPWKKRLLEIRYANYELKDRHILPSEIEITAIDTDQRTTIDIAYRNIEFNRNLNFPYKIPKGYEEIVLK
jgi:hypothetical protein